MFPRCARTQGITWGTELRPAHRFRSAKFYIAKPGDSAATINAALAAGKNLLFTPGVYHLNDTIRVTRANTVVLGLGLATLVPDNGVTAMTVADVDGVKLAGLLIDAGTTNSAVLMQVGPSGSTADHSADPTSLSDVFFRVGGAGVGKATQSLVVNSNNVIGDHMWLWRADHGTGVGWTSNTAANGLVVNGNNVTMYGLFVEHYQQYQTIWNGNGGRTYFYQNEMPYDPPNQAAWMNGSTRGYAAYKALRPRVGSGLSSPSPCPRPAFGCWPPPPPFGPPPPGLGVDPLPPQRGRPLLAVIQPEEDQGPWCRFATGPFAPIRCSAARWTAPPRRSDRRKYSND